MGYEVYCRGEHAYFFPIVATQSDGRRQPEIEADKLREEIKDRGFTFIEADTQIKLTCFATGQDGFEPTAEWSRIQQALKERDELAAELERVKAERDELKANSFSDDLKTMSILAETDQHIKDCKTFLEEFKKLSSIKSRLPVNADGDVPDIGDEQWIWHEHHGPSPTEVHGIRDDGDGWYYVGPDDCGINPLACHSTAESCRAANGGGE